MANSLSRARASGAVGREQHSPTRSYHLAAVLDSLSLAISLSLWRLVITWPHEALHRGEGGRGEIFDAAERKRGERRRLERKATLRMEHWHTHTRHARQTRGGSLPD